jgi:hypothetical protein
MFATVEVSRLSGTINLYDPHSFVLLHQPILLPSQPLNFATGIHFVTMVAIHKETAYAGVI